MIKKRDYRKTVAIFCHDGYDFTIRGLKRALDILTNEQDEDRYLDGKGEGDEVYPLDGAIELIKTRIWKVYEDMTSQKAVYTNDEWRKMKESHDGKAKPETPASSL